MPLSGKQEHMNKGDELSMITLFRKIRLWQLRTKWQLALWQFADKQLMEIIKNPKEIEKKIMPYLAELISKTTEDESKGR